MRLLRLEVKNFRGIRDLSLAPNGDLQFVPEPIARRKLAVLGLAKASLEAAA